MSVTVHKPTDQQFQMETEQSQVSPTISGEIQKRVNAIREIQEAIQVANLNSGITEMEEQITTIKAELLPLCQQYREVMGSNWKDESGFANYVSPGERRSFKNDVVSETLAAMIAQQSALDNLANDAPITFSGENFSNLSVPRLVGNEDVTEAELREILAAYDQMHQSTIQEMRFQIEKMRETLNKLAANQSVTPVKEHVAIK